MGNFRRDNNRFGGDRGRGGGRSFGGGRNFGRRDDRPREMFKTVCDNCKNDCEVPFKPTSGKPVYCSDCFEKMGGRNSDNRSERRDRPNFERNDRSQSPRVDNTKQFEDLNKKLDRIIELLSPKVEEVVLTPEKVDEVKTEKISKQKRVKKSSSKDDKVDSNEKES